CGATASQPACANRPATPSMWLFTPKASCTTTTPPLGWPAGRWTDSGVRSDIPFTTFRSAGPGRWLRRPLASGREGGRPPGQVVGQQLELRLERGEVRQVGLVS